MSARNEIFICLGCLAAASVGFLLVCTYTRFFAGGVVKTIAERTCDPCYEVHFLARFGFGSANRQTP